MLGQPAREVAQVLRLERRALLPRLVLGERAGFLQARDGEKVVASVQLAANLSDAEESNVAAHPELTMGERKLEAPAGFTVSARQGLWLYLALAALLLLLVEWFTYNRRVTV